jgi:hypothetical protein
VAAPYVDPDDLKRTLQINDTFADDDVEAAALAASEAINEELGRRFNKDSSDVVRYLTALDPYTLNVRDLVSITSLQTDDDGDGTYENTWATTDYHLTPLNAATDLEPYTKIEVKLWDGDFLFPSSQKGVKITGKWGWPKVPQRVITAASIIAAQLFKRRRENPSFIITSEAAVVILRNDPQLNALLKGLNRPKVVEG